MFRAKAVLAGPDAEADGAGTGGWHIGRSPDHRAQASSAVRGYDLSGLRGRKIRPEGFNRFDLILAMDRADLTKLQAACPPVARSEMKLFLDYAPHLPESEVPDPR